MKRAPSKVVIVVAAALVAVGGVVLAWFFVFRNTGPAPRPDINVVGGTILVYEIDPGREGADPAEHADVERLASILERRLGAMDLAAVTVRPGGKDRVEILIPRVGDQAEQVAHVKLLVSHVGAMELRVLANAH